MESCCIYICSVGPIEDCCVMLLLRFPPARKCLVGTFESFLCGLGGFRCNLHRADSEGVTNDEVMKEAKKCLKEKGIRDEDVKNLPPIEELCKPIPHSSTIEVHSLQINEGDIPYGKPPDQCLEELDTFIVKQGNFNKQVQNHLLENSRAIHELKDIVERTYNDIKMLCKHFQMVQTQLDQLSKVQKDMLVNASGDKHAYGIRTRSGIATQDPLYLKDTLIKRIEQDSQQGGYSGSP